MRYLATLFLTALLASCGQNIRVTSDYLPSYNFSSLTSYQFLAMDENSYTSLNSKRVANALQQNLAAKGLTLTSKQESDVTVAFSIYKQDKQRQRITSTGTTNMYYGRSYFGPTVNFGTTYIDTIDYQVGNLIIDIIDNKTRQVVYHSVASSEITEGLQPKQREQLIQQAVNQALANFPPKAQ